MKRQLRGIMDVSVNGTRRVGGSIMWPYTAEACASTPSLASPGHTSRISISLNSWGGLGGVTRVPP